MQLVLASVKLAAATLLVLIVGICLPLNAQQQTAGLFVYDTASFEGYTLFSPTGVTTTYLIDNYGRAVHTWESSYTPSQSIYLLENGQLMRAIRLTNGAGVEKLDWDGTVIWHFDYTSTEHRQHHDIEPLPNGNVLILARDFKSSAEANAAGRNPALLSENELWCEFIVEVEPTGPTSANIVWEWHIWDHLIQDYDNTKNNYGDVAHHPELQDINFAKDGKADWIHPNAIEYNPDLDQIVISSRHLCEIWIIDHSTTTEEAASHSGGNRGMGGDILYRWGNPQSYRAGGTEDQKFYAQHDAQWIKPGIPGEGNILVFNNGAKRPEGNYSTVDEFVTPVDEYGGYAQPTPGTAYGPSEQLWIYSANPLESFYSGAISGAQRLPGGNTIICSGRSGRFFEVTPAGEIVWEYINPVTDAGIVEQGEQIPSASNSVFRCSRYAADYVGLAGRDLTPGGQIEIYPVKISGASHLPASPLTGDTIAVTATITDISGIAAAELHLDTGSGFYSISMFDDGNHYDAQAGDDLYGAIIPPISVPGSISYYIYGEDGSGSSTNDPPNAPSITYSLYVEGSGYICGDANGDDQVNVGDAVFVVNYVFKSGPAPDPLCEADSNGDGDVNVGDGVFDINYIFKGGPPPGTDCCP